MIKIRNNPQSDFVLSNAIGITTQDIYDLGFTVVESSSLADFKKLNKFREGRVLTAQADDAFFDFLEGNSYFVLVLDQDGDIAGTIAAFCDRLGQSCLADLWKSRFERCYSGGKMGNMFAPGAYRVSQTAAYMGELWVSKKSARSGLSHLLPRLSMLYSLSKFDADFVYAIMIDKLVRAGTFTKMGFCTLEPSAMSWKRLPTGYDSDFWNFWLAHSTKAQIQHLAYTIFSRNAEK